MAQSHTHKAARATRGRTVPRQRSRTPLVVGALVLVALVLGTVIVSRLAQPTVSVEPFTARVINAPTGTTPEGYAYKGSPDAPVTVIEYGDFQCPSCAAFSQQMEAQFDQQYIETGQVRFIYHDFPLPQHNYAIIAAAATRAAGEQGKFWEMHDLLFTRQRAWSNSSDIEALLGSYAEAIGLDRQAFEQALASEKYTAQLEAAQQQAQTRGVQSTPTFEVNGQLVSAAELQSAVEA
ncbi:MAG TPA: DsbA family protein, partial [Herpetosiphonaceae bacterium]